jgi:ribosomal protein S18 acetylase RimI-like enzyme
LEPASPSALPAGSAAAEQRVEPPATLRHARKDDCRRIAQLFRIASEGVADYVWSSLSTDHPGLSLRDIGRMRYERENTAFSWQNCIVAEHAGEVVGLMHGFVMEASDQAGAPVDPVLRPYRELEVPGSFYISGLAVLPGHRDRGIGSSLLAVARERAHELGADELSLICFAANTGARRLYERHGLRVIDRRPIVPHPLIRVTGDALLMAGPA